MVNADVYSKALYRIAIVVVMSLMLTSTQAAVSAENPQLQCSAEICLEWEITPNPPEFVPGTPILLQGSLTSPSTSFLGLGQGLPFQEIDIEIVGENEVTETYRAFTTTNGQFTARPRLTFPVTHSLTAKYRPAGDKIGPTATSEPLLLAPAKRIISIGLQGSGTITFEAIKCDPICGSRPLPMECPPDCEIRVLAGTDVNLSPIPHPSSAFMGWTKFCQPGERVCKVHLDQDASVKARFDQSSLGIGAGANHSCSITLDRSVKCWGLNDERQLGATTSKSWSAEPVVVENVSNVLSVAAGEQHTCALIVGGTVSCWEKDDAGQVSNDSTISSATAIAVGQKHSCALIVDGTVKCWGSNTRGQLGEGTAGAVANAKAISAGANHTCALLADGKVKCWGANSEGQLGDNTLTDSATPVEVKQQGSTTTMESLEGAAGVSAGGSHTCALIADGTARCWGSGAKGQLGNGTTRQSLLAVPVVGLADVVALSLGSNHSCALLGDGTGRCWGLNGRGQLGDGTTKDQRTATTVLGLVGGRLMTGGGEHHCALVADGGIHCWGDDQFGQLGQAAMAGSRHPAVTSLAIRDVEIDAGMEHSCSIIANGTVRCWGSNSWGQLGDGTTGTTKPSPVNARLDRTAVGISSGKEHTCTLSADGAAHCWGLNNNGQLGVGAVGGYLSLPVRVELPETLIDLSTGGSQDNSHSCAVLVNGEVTCWGNNTYGQLGNATEVNPDFSAMSVAAGGEHTCALISGGSVWCWGRNHRGQLGNGTKASTSVVPRLVEIEQGVPLTDVIKVTAGDAHTCALKVNAEVWCWGDNAWGQLGDGTQDHSPRPTQVRALPSAISVGLGGTHTCALASPGQIFCWGDNQSSQVSKTSPNPALSPQLSEFPVSATFVALGGVKGTETLRFGHTCGISAGGASACWGANDSGQRGDGSILAKDADFSGRVLPVPTQVSGLLSVASVSAGLHHSCAVLTDSNLRCWGNNTSGEIGDGTNQERASPFPVTGIAQAKQVSAGGLLQGHSCAVLSNKTVRCWGGNNFGQLGNGSTASTSIPTDVEIEQGLALTNVDKVSTGGSHTCAIASGERTGADATGGASQLWCWGDNGKGQLGTGSFEGRERPTLTMFPADPTVIPGSAVMDVAAGGYHTCAVLAGNVYCWGWNANGQLANATSTSSSTPLRVVGLNKILQVAAGEKHACALGGVEGNVWCWGLNTKQQLGTGFNAPSSTIVPVLVLAGADRIEAGSNHTCADLLDGSFICWGQNQNGELGRGRTSTFEGIAQVAGVRDPVDISAGHTHTCAVRFDLKLLCWGLTTAIEADIDLGKPRRSRQSWGYVGSSLLQPCDSTYPHVIRGSTGRGLGDSCVLLSALDRTLEVDVFDEGRPGGLEAPITGPVGVGGVIAFYARNGGPLGSIKFCNSSSLVIPDGAFEATVELYEGSSNVPVGTQSSECSVSAPTKGTVTLDVVSG